MGNNFSWDWFGGNMQRRSWRLRVCCESNVDIKLEDNLTRCTVWNDSWEPNSDGYRKKKKYFFIFKKKNKTPLLHTFDCWDTVCTQLQKLDFLFTYWNFYINSVMKENTKNSIWHSACGLVIKSHLINLSTPRIRYSIHIIFGKQEECWAQGLSCYMKTTQLHLFIHWNELNEVWKMLIFVLVAVFCVPYPSGIDTHTFLNMDHLRLGSNSKVMSVSGHKKKCPYCVWVNLH